MPKNNPPDDRRRATDAADAVDAADTVEHGPLERFHDARVVVIDDEPANLSLLLQLLRRKGLRNVQAISDSREALAHIVETDPDLVLLDLHMPGIDGYELLAALRERAGGSYLPVLVLTADTTHQAINRALDLGRPGLRHQAVRHRRGDPAGAQPAGDQGAAQHAAAPQHQPAPPARGLRAGRRVRAGGPAGRPGPDQPGAGVRRHHDGLPADRADARRPGRRAARRWRASPSSRTSRAGSGPLVRRRRTRRARHPARAAGGRQRAGPAARAARRTCSWRSTSRRRQPWPSSCSSCWTRSTASGWCWS